ncbi:nuclear transport factor 2 family protein [Trinickia violacea]|uniref:Nuclear transport factor 2 family protein n=1 Tax=Trinickia violacea TaxID=2571746 RepID=A0A4P8IRK3_9BURK|nr:nuclear transport factor 2 family protein [Trinickia violacea]QCP49594.1 nuclear transport factor 2 family protein [Trinickia violacea]
MNGEPTRSTTEPPQHDDLASRVAKLEAIEAIRELKAHYTALADAKYTSDGYGRVDERTMSAVASQQAQCFTEDAVWHGGEGFGDKRIGREALRQWFMRSPWRFAIHFYNGESIVVDGDSARANWRLWQLALRDDDTSAVFLAGVTDEAYRREADGIWRICEMRFAELQMMQASDLSLPLSPTFAGLDALRAGPGCPERK